MDILNAISFSAKKMRVYISFWFYRWKQRSIKGVHRTLEIETNDSKKGEYSKDFMKIKFNTDDNFPINKPLKLHLLTEIVRCIFEEDGTFYSQLCLDDCLYEVSMLDYDKIDISEGIDVNKTSASKVWYLSLLVF